MFCSVHDPSIKLESDDDRFLCRRQVIFPAAPVCLEFNHHWSLYFILQCICYRICFTPTNVSVRGSTVFMLHPGGAEAGVVPCRPPECLRGRSMCAAGPASRAGGAEGGAETAGWDSGVGQRAPGRLGEGR